MRKEIMGRDNHHRTLQRSDCSSMENGLEYLRLKTGSPGGKLLGAGGWRGWMYPKDIRKVYSTRLLLS